MSCIGVPDLTWTWNKRRALILSCSVSPSFSPLRSLLFSIPVPLQRTVNQSSFFPFLFFISSEFIFCPGFLCLLPISFFFTVLHAHLLDLSLFICSLIFYPPCFLLISYIPGDSEGVGGAYRHLHVRLPARPGTSVSHSVRTTHNRR